MSSHVTDDSHLRGKLVASLPVAAREAIEAIVRAAASAGGVFAVGGALRDLLLGRETADIDLVCEGDAIDLARRVLPGTKLTTHTRFRTASAVVGGVRIDVATARSETYARPGALPRVSEAGIEADLRRRDFSMNAIALRLDGQAVLLDPCGGVADIEASLVRVLHDRSFSDDPTRIYRAWRYAARLDFAVEPHTRRLLATALPAVSSLSGARLRREFEAILREGTATSALELCQASGALQAAHRLLHWNAAKSRAFTSQPARHVATLPFGFALLGTGATERDVANLVTRLRLRRDEAAAVAGIAAMSRTADLLSRRDVKPSGVVGLLERYPLPSVLAFAMTTGNTIARQLALRYIEQWRQVRPLLGGRELQALGVPVGPQTKQALQLIRAARLDGWADDRDDERALAMRFIKSIRDSSVMSATIEVDP